MVHMVVWFAFSTCVCFAVAFSQGVPLQRRSCEEVCSSCEDDEIAMKAACNCTTTEKRLIQDTRCHGKLLKRSISTGEKSAIRRKRCTAEELYQLREKIEATRRNIEWLRHKKTLPVVNPLQVYYPRQANSIPSVAVPSFKSLDSAKDLLRSEAGLMENARNPRTWQRKNQGQWDQEPGIKEEPSRYWRHLVGKGQDQETHDINDSAPRRHIERAPLVSQETTTADPVEFLKKRRRILEEHLQMLLKNTDTSSPENSKSKIKSKLTIDSVEDLSKHPREIDAVSSFNLTNPTTKNVQTVMIAQFHKGDDTKDALTDDNKTLSKKSDSLSGISQENQSRLHSIKATTKDVKTAMIAQFHKGDDTKDSLIDDNKTLSKKSDSLSGISQENQPRLRANVTRPLRIQLYNKTKTVESLPASKDLKFLEITTETVESMSTGHGHNSTRKLLDVIVDIAVLPPSRGNTADAWISELVDSMVENEEERRNESFISQHTPHTLSPPIVLDSNPGYRISRNHEDEPNEDGDETKNKNFVPSVSKVFILKSFKSESANFGIPKANDLFLHKKRPTTRRK